MSDDLDPRIIQGMQRQLANRRAALEGGARPIGWKIGFGSAGAMSQLGITAPLAGWLVDAGLIESRSVQSVTGWAKPMFEPEVAVHIARDVPGGSSPEVVAAAIGGLGAAIELVDLDPPPGDIEEILAGNIYHQRVMLGPAKPGASVQGVTGRVFVDGEEVASTSDPEELPGEPVSLAKHAADLLEEVGERLRAGDVIITGAIVAPLEIRAGSTYRYDLEPLGSLELSFT